jgi:predicted RNA binding protein YcfA (HicA-like mRNA interferase family)
MAIDYRGLRSLTARELIAALNRDGFSFVRQVGSHQRYAHPDGRRVTVAPPRQRRHIYDQDLEIDDRDAGEMDCRRLGASPAPSLSRDHITSGFRQEP